MIILVFGLPGSGKSYFASRLAEKLKAVYLSTDRIRKSFDFTVPYSKKAKELVYDQIMHDMIHHVANGSNVVLDGTFYKARLRDRLRKEVVELGQEMIFIEIQSDLPTTKRRLTQDREYSDADFEVYQKIAGAFEPMDEGHLILQSTNENITEMLEKAMDHLSN